MRKLTRSMAFFLLTPFLLSSCIFGEKEKLDDSAQSGIAGLSPGDLKGFTRKIVENIKTWSVKNALFLQSALDHAKQSNPLSRLEKNGTMNLAEGEASRKQNALHQYLICNSPMRGFYVYGLMESPLAQPLINKFPLITNTPGLKQFAGMVGDKNFTVMGMMGVDIETGFQLSMMLGREVFTVPGLDLYLGTGVDFVVGDSKVYHETYVGSLPVPIPNTPIVLDAELYMMNDSDEAGILLNYALPTPLSVGAVQIQPAVGISLAFSRTKIAQIADMDRWTGKKATDCGVGEEKEAPQLKAEAHPALDDNTFLSAEQLALCRSKISQGPHGGNQKCHKGALVNQTSDILTCLRAGGGQECVTGENRCGEPSQGAHTCNIENTLECLCNGGGIPCFRDGHTVDSSGPAERRVCWKN